MKQISAIIPAAGLSSRMNGFKPLMPLGRHTMIEESITSLKRCGIPTIIVVTGHRSEMLESVIRNLGAIPTLNPGYRSGMFSSILIGIRHLDKSCNGFFVLPADIPLVRLSSVERILAAFGNGKKKIIYPVFHGKRGHPSLISASLINSIKRFKSGGGLKACLEQFEDDSEEVRVCDRGIHMDADTPGDYSAILDRYQTIDIPDTEECLCLLEEIGKVPEPVIRHCEMVAAIGVAIGRTLSDFLCLDLKKIAAGALLHDIARHKKNHSRQGGVLLESMGFGAVGDIVRLHMDLTTSADTPLNETEIVFLADKLTVNDRLETDFHLRFLQKKAAWKSRPEVQKAICGRLETTTVILKKVKTALRNNSSSPHALKAFPDLTNLLFE